jgi:hypothetical protein
MNEPRTTFAFDVFWEWLGRHAGCIVRAGTPEAVLYDDDDLHWTFATEEEGTVVVQVLHGKRLIGEIFVDTEQIAYVQSVPTDTPDEHTFELIAESESERFAPCFFVLVHGLELDEGGSPHQVH